MCPPSIVRISSGYDQVELKLNRRVGVILTSASRLVSCIATLADGFASSVSCAGAVTPAVPAKMAAPATSTTNLRFDLNQVVPGLLMIYLAIVS